MTNDEMLQAVKTLRSALAATTIGPMHAYWDLIFDAEAIAKGAQSILPRPVVEEMLAAELEKLKGTAP